MSDQLWEYYVKVAQEITGPGTPQKDFATIYRELVVELERKLSETVRELEELRYRYEALLFERGGYE